MAVEPAPPPPPGSRVAVQRHITGLSFDDRGDQLIIAAEDETFRLYNCKIGKQVACSVLLLAQGPTDSSLQAHKNATF